MKKKLTVSKAKKRAWSAFSLWVRSRGSVGGMNNCVTCGRLYPIKGRGVIQAGHFIPGRHNSLLFDERNCHPQCYGCNVMKKGNMVKYYKWMRKTYGTKVINELEKLDNKIVKYSVEDLLEIEKHYLSLTR